MSNKAIDLVFSHSKSTGSARCVLLAIADRANDAGECWPSIADIARRANVGERQARYVVKSLVKSGELSIVTRGGGRPTSGRRTTNTYLITLEKGAAGCRVSDSERVQSSAEKGAAGCRSKPAIQRTKRVQPVAGEPSLTQQQEPPKNPKRENRFANSGLDAAAERQREAVSEPTTTETASAPATTNPTEQATGERIEPPADRRGSYADRRERVAAKLERSADRWRASIPPDVRSEIEQIEAESSTIAAKERKSEADSERLWNLSIKLDAIRKTCRAAYVEADRRHSAKYNRGIAEKQRRRDEADAIAAANYVPSDVVRKHVVERLLGAGCDDEFAQMIAVRLMRNGRSGIEAADRACDKLAASSGVQNPGGWMRAHFRREGLISTASLPRIPNHESRRHCRP